MRASAPASPVRPVSLNHSSINISAAVRFTKQVFALIELFIVVAIIAAILFPAFASARKNAGRMSRSANRIHSEAASSGRSIRIEQLALALVRS